MCILTNTLLLLYFAFKKKRHGTVKKAWRHHQMAWLGTMLVRFRFNASNGHLFISQDKGKCLLDV